MQFTAAQIAMIINGKVEGNPETLVHSFGKIEEAQAGQRTPHLPARPPAPGSPAR